MSRVRIVGGQWRSRLLTVPEVPKISGLRPSPDRVRETLFNWLGQDLDGQHCVDLFAGSGILGFEAASRGAERVVLVERSRPLCAHLRDAVHSLGATQVEIVCGDALEFARNTTASFDGAFIDPPYHQGLIAALAPLLDRLVRTDGWLYVEAESAIDALGAWQTEKRGRAGAVHYHLLRRSQS